MTTASVPWLTGTAINPSYERRTWRKRDRRAGSVYIYHGWSQKNRKKCYGDTAHFKTRRDQASYVYDWLCNIAKLPDAADKLE